MVQCCDAVKNKPQTKTMIGKKQLGCLELIDVHTSKTLSITCQLAERSVMGEQACALAWIATMLMMMEPFIAFIALISSRDLVTHIVGGF